MIDVEKALEEARDFLHKLTDPANMTRETYREFADELAAEVGGWLAALSDEDRNAEEGSE